MDVERCLKWLDSGQSSCVCGLLGPAPKLLAAHSNRQPSIAGPKEASPFKDKRKVNRGFVGPQPKDCFKTIYHKRVPGQSMLNGLGSKILGLGSAKVATRIEKVKSMLVSNDLRPKSSMGIWDTGQKQGTGFGRSDDLTVSTFAGGSTAVMQPRVAFPSPIPDISFPLCISKGSFVDLLPHLELVSIPKMPGSALALKSVVDSDKAKNSLWQRTVFMVINGTIFYGREQFFFFF